MVIFVMTIFLCNVGASTAYDLHNYAYAQAPADAQAPPTNGTWYSQYQNTGAAVDYAAAGYAFPQTGQAVAYGGSQPPPPPSEVPPPPPA